MGVIVELARAKQRIIELEAKVSELEDTGLEFYEKYQPTSTQQISFADLYQILRGYFPEAPLFLGENYRCLCNYDDIAVFLAQDQTNKFKYIGDKKEISSYDCVTGDTPILVKNSGGLDIVETRELLPVGTLSAFSGYEILTPTGFSLLMGVRKKKTQKPIIRVLGTSDVGLTIDHKLALGGKKYLDLSKAKDESEVLRCPFTFPTTEFGDYGLGWAYGLFFSDGSCGTGIKNHDFWNITNSNFDYLERAAVAFGQHCLEFSFDVETYPSIAKGTRTNYGVRRQQQYVLEMHLKERHNDGTRQKLVQEFHKLFYNSFKVKRVPSSVLLGSLDFSRGFYDGAYAGDGRKSDYGYITSASKLATYGLSMLLRKLGHEPVVLNEGNNSGCSFINHRKKFQRKRKWLVPSKADVIYDIQTGNGEFLAGDLAVKNCNVFANRLLGQFSVPGWSDICFGKVWLKVPAHALNCMVSEDKKFWYVEPQRDTLLDYNTYDASSIRFIEM